MADITARAAVAAQDIRNFAEARLRDEFPYMKTEKLDQLLNKIAVVSLEDVVEQTGEMNETLQRSNLFSLSAELRNAIYEEVLIEHDFALHMQDDYFPSWQNEPPPIPALLHVSQQVRNEAAPIYYGANAFWASTYMIGSSSRNYIEKPLELWLSLIGPKQCKMIKGLILDFQNISVPRGWGDNEDEYVDEVKANLGLKGWGASFNQEVAIASRREMVKVIRGVTRLGVPSTAIHIRFRSRLNHRDWRWVRFDSIVIPGWEEWEDVMNMAQVRDEVISASRARANAEEDQGDNGT